MRNSSKINLIIASLLSVTAYAADLTTDKIEVISATPLPSIGLTLDQFPSTVQNVKTSDLKKSKTIDIGSFMNENLAGVDVNETQGNPIQSDVNYHGFTASPLLGTPQGISVYVDGVRMNQPFGDVVSWDLIPKNAISNMQLYSGSNPLFGLNTLGGALAINTKDGRNNPGAALQFSAGSWGRKIGEFEYGGVSEDNSKDFFIAGTWFDENGWRDRSPSENKQLFTKLGWRNDTTSLKLSYSFANSDLNGNGLSPLSQLQKDYESVFTYPDNTKNTSHLINLNWDHYFTKNVMFAGNAYYRNIKTTTYNGDINDEAFGDTVSWGGTNGETNQIPASTAYTAYSLAAQIDACLAQNTGRFDDKNSTTDKKREAGEKCNGLINRTRTNQENAGIFAQVSVENEIFKRPNSYILGAGYDFSRSRFSKTAEYGSLAAGGSIVGSGYFATENRDKPQNLNDVLDARDANVKNLTNTWSLLGSDTIALRDNLHLTASGRYNYVRVKSADQNVHHLMDLTTDLMTSNIDSDASLSGNHTFARFNPSVGLTLVPIDNLTTYAKYGEGSRAPTAMELTCANPNAPCSLPNAMAGDPSLKQVISKTFEGGLRGKAVAGITYNLNAYNTRLVNDIQFVSASAAKGYFTNIGETQRRGFDLTLSKTFDKFALAGTYSYLEATYESPAIVNSITGTRNIQKGDEIPGMPNNVFKLFADYKFDDKLTLSANTKSATAIYVRGAEDNEGQGAKLPGYTVLNLALDYKAAPGLSIFANVLNVFDKEYYTAGALGSNPYDSAGTPYLRSVSGTSNTTTNNTCAAAGYSNGSTCYYGSGKSYAETFAAPGAPRAAWIGVRYEFGGKK